MDKETLIELIKVFFFPLILAIYGGVCKYRDNKQANEAARLKETADNQTKLELAKIAIEKARVEAEGGNVKTAIDLLWDVVRDAREEVKGCRERTEEVEEERDKYKQKYEDLLEKYEDLLSKTDK